MEAVGARASRRTSGGNFFIDAAIEVAVIANAPGAELEYAIGHWGNGGVEWVKNCLLDVEFYQGPLHQETIPPQMLSKRSVKPTRLLSIDRVAANPDRLRNRRKAC